MLEFCQKTRQIEGRSALFCKSVNNLSQFFLLYAKIMSNTCWDIQYFQRLLAFQQKPFSQCEKVVTLGIIKHDAVFSFHYSTKSQRNWISAPFFFFSSFRRGKLNRRRRLQRRFVLAAPSKANDFEAIKFLSAYSFQYRAIKLPVFDKPSMQ